MVDEHENLKSFVKAKLFGGLEDGLSVPDDVGLRVKQVQGHGSHGKQQWEYFLYTFGSKRKDPLRHDPADCARFLRRIAEGHRYTASPDEECQTSKGWQGTHRSQGWKSSGNAPQDGSHNWGSENAGTAPAASWQDANGAGGAAPPGQAASQASWGSAPPFPPLSTLAPRDTTATGGGVNSAAIVQLLAQASQAILAQGGLELQPANGPQVPPAFPALEDAPQAHPQDGWNSGPTHGRERPPDRWNNDWYCSTCKWANFAKNVFCNRCNKSVRPGTPVDTARGLPEGYWCQE